MYAKFTISLEYRMDDLLRHLCCNGYSYYSTGNYLFIHEDDMDWVQTILDDWGYEYELNDEEVKHEQTV